LQNNSKIILATFSYFPHAWGGSELYVSALAKELLKNGYEVEILAGMPEEKTNQYNVFYQDGFIKVVRYIHEGIPVVGCSNKVITDEIYSRYNSQWEKSWTSCLNKLWEKETINVLHLHGHTALVGTALINAVKEHSPESTIAFTYHVVETCPSGSLLYFNKKNCSIRPNTAECSKCVLSNRLGVSEKKVRIIQPFFPNITFSEKVPAILKTKHLVHLSISSFERFYKLIDQWFVFSEQCQASLLRFGIENNKIALIRHGINKLYLSDTQKTSRENHSKIKFIYVGRFQKLKGIQTLLKAWLQLEELDNRELLLIGGASDMEPSINVLVNKIKKRSDVSFFGVLSQKEIKAILETGHCLIIPSEVSETGPYVFHEAIACGVNVLASDIGGCAELAGFYGQGCELFKVKDSSDLAKKIKRFKYEKPLGSPETEERHFEKILKVYKKFKTATLV
jgi:glycosyltransferase involved in cell wall biosynthesis